MLLLGMKKALFIDATAQTITEIELGDDFREISKKIGCDLFTVATELPNMDALYVDDEGLINGTENFFYHKKLYTHPLAGNGIILGTDDEGDSVDVKTNAKEFDGIKFFTMEEVREAYGR